ncbi:MAG: outer membrane beta-barrel domain-containing protein [Oligoflexales bacterium]
MNHLLCFRSSSRVIGSLGIVLSVLLSVGKAYGLELKPSEIRAKTQNNPVTVLQNRYFLKAWRPEIGFATGSFLNEAYTDTTSMGLRASLFVNEYLGVEAQHFKTTVKDSDDRIALNDIEVEKDGKPTTVDPEVNPVSKIVDLNAIYAPFYGKLNLADQLIVYSDLYFTGGMSKVSTVQGDLNALALGAGQRFYLEKSVSFRIDFRDRIYTEKRGGKDSRKNSYSVDFGMSYFFL